MSKDEGLSRSVSPTPGSIHSGIGTKIESTTQQMKTVTTLQGLNLHNKSYVKENAIKVDPGHSKGPSYGGIESFEEETES